MLQPQHSLMIANLERLLRDGTLTAARKVAEGTIICMTESYGPQKLYHQMPFEELPPSVKELIDKKETGFAAGPLKILGVFHLWESPLGVPPKNDGDPEIN